MTRGWIAIGALSGLISVATGAFGAHALAKKLDPRMLEVWHTSSQYEMYHALALLGLGIWLTCSPQAAAAPLAQWAGGAFLVGTILFSGSLYALALSGVRVLGAITPLGGLSFLAGWLLVAILAWRT